MIEGIVPRADSGIGLYRRLISGRTQAVAIQLPLGVAVGLVVCRIIALILVCLGPALFLSRDLGKGVP